VLHVGEWTWDIEAQPVHQVRPERTAYQLLYEDEVASPFVAEACEPTGPN